MRVISVASFVTDIITPSRHRGCKAGCRTNSFRVDDKNCDFSRIRRPVKSAHIDPVGRDQPAGIHLRFTTNPPQPNYEIAVDTPKKRNRHETTHYSQDLRIEQITYRGIPPTH